MGNLERFLAKPKEIDINGEKITLHPMRVKDLKLFVAENPTKEQQEQMTKEMIKLSVRDTTDEEIDNLPSDVAMILIEEINKLNGFTDERLAKFTKTPR